jgi:hypothetical protein
VSNIIRKTGILDRYFSAIYKDLKRSVNSRVLARVVYP